MALSTKIQEEIYFHALTASVELAERHGPHPTFAETRMAAGWFQFDLWGVRPENVASWEALRVRIKQSGLRNSLVIAIAPDGNDCFDCGLLRVHRTADFQPVQA